MTMSLAPFFSQRNVCVSKCSGLIACYILFASTFFSALSVASQASEENWTWRAPTLQGNHLVVVAVSTTTPQIIVGAGELGTLVTKTGNGPWLSKRVPDLRLIFQMHWTGTHFIGGGLRKDGQVVILRSVDGENWAQSNFPAGVDGYGASAIAGGAGRVIVIANDGETFVSDDSAQSWSHGPRLPSANSSDVWPARYWDLATDGKGCWVAVGTGGTIATSVDDGASWTKFVKGNEDYYNVETDGSSFILEGNLNRSGSARVVYRSSDGLAWYDAKILEPGLPPDIFPVEIDNFYGVRGSFLAASYTSGGQYWYESKDGGVTWQRLILSSDSDQGFELYYVGDVAASASGALTMVGRGGLIVSLSPRDQSQALQRLESKPFFGSSIPLFFTSAGGNGKFVATANYPKKFVSSTDGINFLQVSSDGWSQSAVTWDGNGFLGAHIDYRQSGSEYLPHVVFETSMDGLAWQEPALPPPLPTPSLLNAHQVVVGIAQSASAHTVVLVVEQAWDQNTWESNSTLTMHQWNGVEWSKIIIPSSGFVNNDAYKSVRPQIQWDGSQFLFLTPRGVLWRSLNGSLGTWSSLPALPADSSAYLSTYFTSIFSPSGAPAANVIYSFASDGRGAIVARPSKLSTAIDFENPTNGSLGATGPDRFFVLRPAPNDKAWLQIHPRQDPSERYTGCNIIWNGSFFSSANAAGFLRTSPDGFTWTRRDLGADVKSLTWTGTEIVGLAEHNSIITHPTGLSRPVSYPPDLGFADWLQFHGLTGVAAQPGATPAGDGISNLLKYAFNLDPKQHVGIGKFPHQYYGLPYLEASPVGDYLHLIYFRDPAKPNIRLVPVWQSKLQESSAWNEVSDREFLGIQEGVERWRARIPMAGGLRQGFMRLNVLMD